MKSSSLYVASTTPIRAGLPPRLRRNMPEGPFGPCLRGIELRDSASVHYILEGVSLTESIAAPAAGVAVDNVGGAVVEAHDLSRRYGEGDTAVDALRGVNLEIERRKLTAVMGPSGSGKSTLMHLLAALDLPTSGYVVLAGTKLGDLSDKEITKLRRKHIGFIFQFFNLLPMLTAEENVVLPLSIAGEKPDKE